MCIRDMKIKRVYTREVPVWKCNQSMCGYIFHIEGFALNGFYLSWGNKDAIPYCPRCGNKNCSVIETFPEFSDE